MGATNINTGTVQYIYFFFKQNYGKSIRHLYTQTHIYSLSSTHTIMYKQIIATEYIKTMAVLHLLYSIAYKR